MPSGSGPAGLFIDEAYYLACTERLALGYVDHPPLSIYLLALVRALAGDALPVVRFVPALVGAACVLMAGTLARRLGAGAWGQGIAGLAVATAPVFQILFGFYSMNAFSILFWCGAFLLLIEIEQRKDPRLWLAFGALTGVALQNKHTILLLAVGLGVGMVLTRARRHLASPWLWAGLGLAGLIIAPNVVWQAQHDWASLEFYRQADALKNVATPPLDVVAQQILGVNPVALPLWLSGLGFLLLAPRGAQYRHLGILYLVLLAMMVLGAKSRPDRIAAVYPLLFAAGGAWLDPATERAGFAWVRIALPAAMIAVGVAFVPLSVPVLSPETAARYAEWLGVVPQIEAGEGKRSPLPQWLADRYEWDRLVDDVAAVVAQLSAEERSRSVIFGSGYGQAAFVERLGGDRELPAVYSGHNSYFFWGPPPEPVAAVVMIGFGDQTSGGQAVPEAGLREIFGRIELAKLHRCRFCMSWRDEMPIWIARDPKRPVSEVWDRVRSFR
ncbi:MAG: glycosyltransferase family 39 protein [bacterium]|nr:glycosyltransferase family 39 protein [bacterium]